jgi:hypothetical protein
MTTTMLLNRANAGFNSLAKLKLLTLAAFASMLFLAMAPSADAQTVTLLGRTLRRTAFQTNNLPVSAGCGAANCTDSVPIFNPILSMQCPAPANGTCTIYAHLETHAQVSFEDSGQFRFLVDGLPPVPGPTDANGLFIWLSNDPDSAIIRLDARSYAVVARVTNAVANQVHFIEAHIGCTDQDGSGSCAVTSGFANLEANVYTP